jgi:hypothetical protein
MRIAILATVLAVLGCTPGTESGLLPGDDVPTTPDTGGGGDVTEGCTAVRCNNDCRAAGFPGGACRGGVCVCTGDDGTIPSGAGESCGDGIDNNGNGAVDEGCGCAVGTTQPCFTGLRESRGVGACSDGVQQCQGGGEFSHWGPCTGDTLPTPEVCDGIDNDCDVARDEGCPDACVPSEFAVETICDDGLDNECDGVADCFDPDCPPCCGEEICADGIDNDCDGMADEYCDEPCTPVEIATVEGCSDGIDNDCDTRADCYDIDCVWVCCTPESCGDTQDNDCDGSIDCNDSDCCTEMICFGSEICGSLCCMPGTWRYCDTPSYCSWGRQECRPDGYWGSCAETGAPAECAGMYYYNASCCVSAGYCCQNFPFDDTSIGTCTGVAAGC